MGIVVPIFAIGFNALLWLGRVALAPVVAPRLGALAAWAIAVVAPLALLAIVVRLRLVRRDVGLLLASLSLAIAAISSNS